MKLSRLFAVLAFASLFLSALSGITASVITGMRLRLRRLYSRDERSFSSSHPGSTAFLEYDYQNQDQNWKGSSSNSADANADKKIITNFVTFGYQHMFNRSWGVMGEIPFANRYFKTADEDTGDIMEFTHGAVGDIRLKGIYSGFFENMSTGLTFGIKFPTGDYQYEHFDPDVQIGSGSTRSFY